MKEFIKCKDVIVNKKNIQCIRTECLINGDCNIIINLNDDLETKIYIMCNNETEARTEFDNIYNQLQEEEMRWTPYTEGVVEESQPQKYKITLKEFWESDRNLAIHCNTEEKARKLLEAFDKLGKKWCEGDSYTKKSNYNVYECNTCYSNQNGYCEYDYFEGSDYTIYEFEDVDLDN